MTSSPTQLGLREVLQIQSMRRLWLAQIISIFGDFLAFFAVLSHVSFNLHATAAQVTWISIAFMLPFALIGLFPVAAADGKSTGRRLTQSQRMITIARAARDARTPFTPINQAAGK